MKIVAVQSVFYNCAPEELSRFCQCLMKLRVPEGWQLEIHTGNCGAKIEWPIAKPNHWRHTEFGSNLGFGKGHNQLFDEHAADSVWILNPDTAFFTDTLSELIQFADVRPDWGLIEARQIPLEHPKAIDPQSLESSWCSGCAVLVKSAFYRKVGGFDECFFLYSEDVDISWRIRAAGGRLYCCPGASVYHSRLGDPSTTEVFWATVSELILLKKYGRGSHLVNRIADLAPQTHSADVFQEVVIRLPRMSRASPCEVHAATWSGRLNAPSRFAIGPLPANSEGILPGIRIKDGDPYLQLESALAAWAIGISKIDAIDTEGRLPFAPEDSENHQEIEAGQMFFPNGPQGNNWIQAKVKQCQKGWLTQAVIVPTGPPMGTEIKYVNEPMNLLCDPDGWRLVARTLRSHLRIARLPKTLKSMAKEILLG